MKIASPTSAQRLLTLTDAEEAALTRLEARYGPEVVCELVANWISERTDHHARQDVELLMRERAVMGSPLVHQIEQLAGQARQLDTDRAVRPQPADATTVPRRPIPRPQPPMTDPTT